MGDDGGLGRSEGVGRSAASGGGTSDRGSYDGCADGMGQNSGGSIKSAVPRVTSASSGLVSRGSGATSTREANYEEGASELFLLVENAAWQDAITR